MNLRSQAIFSTRIGLFLAALITVATYFSGCGGETRGTGSVRIEGVVLDSSGSPLPDMIVSVPGQPETTVTDSSGNFSLQAQGESLDPDGSLQLDFERGGFSARGSVMDISDAEPVQVRVEANLQVGTVTISKVRTPTPPAMASATPSPAPTTGAPDPTPTISAPTPTSTPTVCSADFNHDGVLTQADYDEYVSAFELGDASADYNHDGFVNANDLDAFGEAFDAGC